MSTTEQFSQLQSLARLWARQSGRPVTLVFGGRTYTYTGGAA